MPAMGNLINAQWSRNCSHCDTIVRLCPFWANINKTHIYSTKGAGPPTAYPFICPQDIPDRYSWCHGDAYLCSGIYCLHCGRLPLLNMPHKRLKEAAPFTVLHPAGKSAGEPEACWEAQTFSPEGQYNAGQCVGMGLDCFSFYFLAWAILGHHWFINYLSVFGNDVSQRGQSTPKSTY